MLRIGHWRDMVGTRLLVLILDPLMVVDLVLVVVRFPVTEIRPSGSDDTTMLVRRTPEAPATGIRRALGFAQPRRQCRNAASSDRSGAP